MRRLLGILGCLWAGLAAAAAIAVDGPLNEADPEGGLPWANVGVVDGTGSGIYLGNGWVLSAQRVTGSGVAAGGVTFTLEGETYSNINTVVTLENPDGSASALTLFNIGTSPNGLNPISLLSAPPSAGAALTLVGYGEHAGSPGSFLDALGNPIAGYTLDGQIGQAKAWGGTTVLVNAGLMSTPGEANPFVAMLTNEFSVTGSSETAQAEAGDWGGAAFVNVDGTWYLAGTINAITASSVMDQNGNPLSSTVAEGDSAYLADISAYRDQIDTWIAMTPVPEPGTISLLLAGGLGAGWRLLRRRR